MYTWLPLNSSADLAQLEKHISPEYGEPVSRGNSPPGSRMPSRRY